MKMKVPEKKEEFPLGKELLDVEIVHEKNDLKRVKLIFDDNRAVEFIHGSYSSGAQVYVEEPPEMVTKYVASGMSQKHQTPVRALFDRETDANDFAEGELTAGIVRTIKVAKEDLEHNDGDEIPF